MAGFVLISRLLFQSAPLTDVRGDKTRIKRTATRTKRFQSAPLTDVRGDITGRPVLGILTSKFQSAPLTDVRGDMRLALSEDLVSIVSIRSPHGCKGRSPQCDPTPTGQTRGFNPLPSRM